MPDIHRPSSRSSTINIGINLTIFSEFNIFTPIFPESSKSRIEGDILCERIGSVLIVIVDVMPSLISPFELLISLSTLKVFVWGEALFETKDSFPLIDSPVINSIWKSWPTFTSEILI